MKRILVFLFLASIFLIPLALAVPAGEDTGTINTGQPVSGNVSLHSSSVTYPDGTACTAASQCSGGYCNSNVCASSAPSTTTTTTSSGGGGGTSATTTSAAATTPAAEIVSEKTVITDAAVINDLFSSLTPSDLGVASLDSGKVDVVRTGTVSAATTATAATIQDILAVATDESAKQAISDMKSGISSSSSQAVSVSAKLEVFNITSKETNKTSIVSKITLTITADKDMKNLNLIEVIPKDVAKNLSEVAFKVQPKILQSDPIVQWTFDAIGKGETKDLSYTVNKKLSSITSTSLAAAKVSEAAQPPAQPGQPAQQPAKPADMTIVYLVVAIILIAIAAYFVAVKKKIRFRKK